MIIKSRVFTPIVLVSLTVFGCNEATPPTSDAFERAASSKPTLTSTALPALPKPAEAKQPEPSVVEAEEAPLAAEERSFVPELESMDGLTIRRLITAPEIEHREPVAASSVFGRHEERVYAFVEVSNESEDVMTLLVHFIGPRGQVSGGIELNIPPAVPRWRTWAHTRHAKEPGLWHVEIRSAEGQLLGALPFEVEADH
jgi:Protein of unknown function (DUF2914)